MSEEHPVHDEHAGDANLSFEEEVAAGEEDDDPHSDFPSPDPDR